MARTVSGRCVQTWLCSSSEVREQKARALRRGLIRRRLYFPTRFPKCPSNLHHRVRSNPCPVQFSPPLTDEKKCTGHQDLPTQ